MPQEGLVDQSLKVRRGYSIVAGIRIIRIKGRNRFLVRGRTNTILTITVFISGVTLLTTGYIPQGIGPRFNHQALNHRCFLTPFFSNTEIPNRFTTENGRIQNRIMRGTHASRSITTQTAAI